MKNVHLYIWFILLLSCTHKSEKEEALKNYSSYEKAFTYLESGKSDSAFLCFGQAKEQFLENRDSLNSAVCLINMAIILTDQGDYYGAQETSVQAIPFLDSNNLKHHSYISSNYNNLGIATYHLLDYPKALHFYSLAIKFSDDSLNISIYLNNKAKVYHDQGQYTKAIKIYDQLIKRTSKNDQEYARIITNIALSRWRQNPVYNPAPIFLTALHIRQDTKDLLGQNSSYAHLSDYYSQNQTDSALFYAHKMYKIAKAIKNSSDQIQALQKLIELNPQDSTKQYFQTYQQLRDSVELARNTDKNQFALIRYEVEKNKAENLKLQKDNAEKSYQISRQRIFTLIVVLSTIIVAIAGIYWYKKRKQRLELESENKIKAHQLKTSKKIHDVVANGLYRVMAEVENKSDLDREELLDKLETMYEKSRDISYETEDPTVIQQDFNEKITGLLTSFATESTRVIIAGNEPGLWQNVAIEAKYEVEHILQELMVNMRKHSQASRVNILFEQQDARIQIHYSDNGVGLPKTFRARNGLRNTGNRIKNLQGILTFGNEGENGLKIHISFPVA